MGRRILALTLAVLLASSPMASAQKLYMKDTPMDAGVEPNPDTGPMWVTEDIWVRRSPDPGYVPQPFPEGAPTWVPQPHENPEYRDPKYSVPNYVYVRVRNAGASASTGSERLRLYWAKASTGLAWPTQWVDYLATNCGPSRLYGAEITKPRRNAGLATDAERNAYRNAILEAGTNASYVFPLGASYWHTQQTVHAQGPANRHGTAAFLPWHREFVNRYEVALQEVDPTVKLLYWDWTTNPENTTNGFNIFTPTFMGASGAGTGGVSIGAPFNPAAPPTLAPPNVTRNLGGNPLAPTPTTTTDATLLGPANSTFPAFRVAIEGGPHDYSHGYLGGGGDMSFISAAARDPVFFMLHANVDRIWANWQRASLSRLAPATAYGTEQSNANITTTMRPWNGTGTAIQPWTVAGGYVVTKAPTDRSVVSPPIYDTAPLVVPALQPGQAVVLEIPWYPPNPAHYACFGPDQGHFCLLARVETATAAPFGMTTPETSDVFANTRNNARIVWKNITVVDNFAAAAKMSSVLIRNVFREPIRAGLRIADTGLVGASFFGRGRTFLDLGPELFRRWRAGGGEGRGIEVRGDGGRLEVLDAEAFVQNIPLDPGETFSVGVQFELSREYPIRQAPAPVIDLIQTGAPGNPAAIVGGQRFVLDVRKLVLVRSGGAWRYHDNTGENPGGDWREARYDDSKWKLGAAPLRTDAGATTTLDPGRPPRGRITTYFRHVFEVPDPGFYRRLTLRLQRDDGAIVYVNGKEAHRVHLPAGAVTATTPATRDVTGLERDVFFPVPLSPAILQRGRNVVAVEIHRQTRRRGDIGFDLELTANRDDAGFDPAVAFASPPDGTLYRPGEVVTVAVDAIDPDGKGPSVSLFVDGKEIGTTRQAPYRFRWTVDSIGPHQLRAVALDADKRRATAFLTLTGVENVPPSVTLRGLSDGAAVGAEVDTRLAAEASDRDGSVRRVEFWAREADFFMSKPQLVATATAAPFGATLRGLAAGHYMIWAVAVDDREGTSQSMPVHVQLR